MTTKLKKKVVVDGDYNLTQKHIIVSMFLHTLFTHIKLVMHWSLDVQICLQVIDKFVVASNSV